MQLDFKIKGSVLNFSKARLKKLHKMFGKDKTYTFKQVCKVIPVDELVIFFERLDFQETFPMVPVAKVSMVAEGKVIFSK